MRSIISLLEKIKRKQFRYNYLKKKMVFLHFFFGLLKSILNFKHLQKKDDPHSCRISGNTGTEKYA